MNTPWPGVLYWGWFVTTHFPAFPRQGTNLTEVQAESGNVKIVNQFVMFAELTAATLVTVFIG